MSDRDFQAAVRATGSEIRDLGVGLALAPILDVVSGDNPWLRGRNLGTDPAAIARVGRAFVLGLQAAGVAATAKHFPGCGSARTDPHSTVTNVSDTREDLETVHLPPFRAAIEAGVHAVMLGPVAVESLDAELPASASSAVVRLLRERLGFRGVAITDDLDSRSNSRGRSAVATGLLALAAGADLLLAGRPGDAVLVAEEVIRAVADGRLERPRLAEAAARVRRLAAGA
jgi:beta-N-acetylhexosaminidase